MNLTISAKLNDLALSHLIQEAKAAEITRDLFIPQEIFKPIWNDIESEPDFSQYDDLQRAELYRLSGYIISNYGKSKSIKNYQERAKNHLTISVELFSKLGLTNQASEAKVILSLCYFHEGAISESEMILEQTALEYESDRLHPVYLRICVNKLLILHWKSEFQKALEIIREIEIPIEFCNDVKLIELFHGQAGMIFRGIQKYDEAIYHYHKSIDVSQKLNRWVSVALTNNNLAFLYKNLKEFYLAHHHIENSIKIFREINQTGWLPHALDTKALIYFAENKFAQSLQTIDEAIEMLRQGEDYAVLIDSIWNKIRCYLALHQKEEAILLFTQLAQLAQNHIGEVAVKKYTKLFTELLYVKQENSLEAEVRRFKKTEIVDVLHQTDFNFEKAAKALGYTTTNKLIRVVNNEFPELYDEIGIQQLIHQPKFKNVKKISAELTDNESLPIPKLINHLELHNAALEFDSGLNLEQTENIKTFYCSSEKMSKLFDVSFDSIIAAALYKQISADEIVLIQKFSTNNYTLAQFSHDNILDIDILIEEDVPISFDEAEIIGKVIGYCLLEEADSEKLKFKPLPKLQTTLVSG